jgi:hypothetical protein
MKTRINRLVVLALGVLTVGALAGRAQITNPVDFKVSQPFTVANTTLPAGNYIVRPVQGEEGVLEIASASGKPSVMVEAESAQPGAGQSGCYLVFNRYKNLLALSQIFPGGGNPGYQLAQGHPEKQAAKTEKPTKQSVTATAKQLVTGGTKPQ